MGAKTIAKMAKKDGCIMSCCRSGEVIRFERRLTEMTGCKSKAFRSTKSYFGNVS